MVLGGSKRLSTQQSTRRFAMLTCKDWRFPLTYRGGLRFTEMLFCFLVFIVAAAGWTCERSTTRNQFLVAVGIMYFVMSAGFFYMEGLKIVMDNAMIPVIIDLLFFIFSFAAACAAILDEEAVNCGYEATKAAAMMMFLCMLAIFASLIISIQDLFATRVGGGKKRQRSMRNLRAVFEQEEKGDVKKELRPTMTTSSSGLPSGWSAHQSDGTTYYFNENTGKSQWHKPTTING